MYGKLYFQELKVRQWKENIIPDKKKIETNSKIAR